MRLEQLTESEEDHWRGEFAQSDGRRWAMDLHIDEDGRTATTTYPQLRCVGAATIEYAVHLATGEPSLPAGEYVYLSCHSPLSSEGFAIEDATLWGPDGRVLAVARQTRLAARA